MVATGTETETRMTEMRKVFAAFVALSLVFGLMPLSAYADNADADDAATEMIADAQSGESAEGEPTPIEVQTAAVPDDANAGGVAQADLSVLSFVYVESPIVAVDFMQNIVVGFVDEGFVAVGAEIDLIGPDGQLVTLSQVDAVEGAILFTADTSSLAPGCYEISAMRYCDANNAVFAVSFTEDNEAEYAFNVVDASDQPATEEGVATEVYTISADGEYVETGSIAEAMAAAGVDPESGPKSKQPAEGELTTQAADGFVIVLDPGHGGYDGGAGGNGLSENVVNLKIAQYCKAKLEQTPGVTVYMTRTNDTYVSLSDRVAFAKSHNADLVVSLHNNAGGGRGSEVIVPRNGSWYYNETYVTGNELGSKILGKLNALGLGTHAGVYSRDCTDGDTYADGTLADYYALINGPREYGILGIIVEHAFIDNASDAAYLTGDANLKRLGEADANAIIEYYSSSKGIDRLYWGVFDLNYYLEHYPDVKNQYGNNKLKVLGHFKSTGMPAGHRGNVLFDVNYYKSNNSDLQKAFGNNLVQYYRHFISYGMKEGRAGSADFIPSYYKANYSDLRSAFGDDMTSYYDHYITYGKSEGRVANVRLESASDSQAVYRLYNPNNGDHHYTTTAKERDALARIGWKYEGVAWNAPGTSSTPVYRLYNPNSGDHHYTTTAKERDALAKLGWKYEGVSWYSAASTGTPLYRLYNKSLTAGTHHYTATAKERDALVKLGWAYEGVAWYGVK